MGKLAGMVTAFIEQRLGGESIDRLALTAEQQASAKADYFLCDRAVVVELKELRDDREARVRAVLEKWRRRPGWPYFPMEVDIDTLLRLHPRASELPAELFDAGTASIEEHFRKANAQLRETGRTFDLRDALGALFLVNDSIDLLDPKVIASKVQALHSKRNQDRTKCFGSIQLVVYFTAAHFAVRGAGPPRPIILSLVDGDFDRVNDARGLAHRITREWCDFLRLPLEESNEPTAAEFETYQFEGRRPPTVY